MTQRQIFSKRFIALFKRLSENGDLSYREVANALDISIKTLNQYLDGTHLITIEEAYLFCQHYELSYNFMFEGITNWEEELAFKLNCGFQSNLPAVGGYRISSNYDSYQPCIDRNISLEKKVFDVIGDSMTGGKHNLEEHDKLETKRICDLSFIKNYTPYVIESDEGICVKELKIIKEDNKVIGVTCTSDLDFYTPYDIEGNERTKFYKIVNVFKESKRKQLIEAIKHDKLKQTLECLLSAFPCNENLITLNGRIVALNNQIYAGYYDLDTCEIKRNRLRSDILNFIVQISKNDLSNIDSTIL